MLKLLVSVLVLYSSLSAASEVDALVVDRVVIDAKSAISFPNENNTQPDISDFKIISYILMSNDNGERWAVVTLKNTAAGSRSFKQSHLLALFANGDRLPPLKYEQSFNSHEVSSITISFGIHKFPILEIDARNKI